MWTALPSYSWPRGSSGGGGPGGPGRRSLRATILGPLSAGAERVRSSRLQADNAAAQPHAGRPADAGPSRRDRGRATGKKASGIPAVLLSWSGSELTNHCCVPETGSGRRQPGDAVNAKAVLGFAAALAVAASLSGCERKP